MKHVMYWTDDARLVAVPENNRIIREDAFLYYPDFLKFPFVITKQPMNAAITILEIALETMITNEPINRREGNIAQADLEAANAMDIKSALVVLRDCV